MVSVSICKDYFDFRPIGLAKGIEDLSWVFGPHVSLLEIFSDPSSPPLFFHSDTRLVNFFHICIDDVQYVFALNSALIVIGAVFVITSIDSRPKDGYEDLEERHRRLVSLLIRTLNHRAIRRASVSSQSEGEPISMLRAILLPGVAAVSQLSKA